MSKISSSNLDDDLRPEYDFERLKVVARGPGRARLKEPLIHLEPDVAEVFPDSTSVNEALRFLMRMAQREAAHSKG